MNTLSRTILAAIMTVAFLAGSSVSTAQVWAPYTSIIETVEANEDQRLLDLSVFSSVHRVRHYSNGRMDSSGSASCVGVTSRYYVFLTNQHVAQGKGHDVRIEMFVEGRKSKPLKGEVVYSRNNSTPHDVAVVIVPKVEGWRPQPVKLALDWVPSVDEMILDYGCSTARAPRMRLGRITRATDTTFTYTPPAWPGDSGSPVLDPTGKWQIGITTWNDGRSTPTIGKAQIISVVAGQVKDNWSHSDPEVASIFDATATRPDGLFRRPPSQPEEFRGFFRRLLDGQNNSDQATINLFRNLLQEMEANRSARQMERSEDRTERNAQFGILQGILAKFNARMDESRDHRESLRADLKELHGETVGLIERLRANRLRHERQLMELEKQRYEMERELEEKYGKQFKRQEEELRGIRGMFQKIMNFITWCVYIGVGVGVFWLMQTLFGPGWLGKGIGMIIKGIRATVVEITKAIKAKLPPKQ